MICVGTHILFPHIVYTCSRVLWGNGDSFYSCVSVYLSVASLLLQCSIFYTVSGGRFFTTQGLHRMNDLEFDPKYQGQQKNQNRAISMFCRVQDKSGATRGSLALRKEDDHGFYFIRQSQGQWPNFVGAAHLSRRLGTV